MKKMFERNSTSDNLTQQFNNDEVQRIVENIKEIPDNFQIPSSILKQREKNWNSLFAKYCSTVSEIELNMVNLQYNKDIIKQQLSMHKPISMIQYWVNTGNQPYSEYFNNRIDSDSGSSLVEESLKSIKTLNSKSQEICFDPKKHKKDEKSFKTCLKMSESSSSIDTADYILANKNTTKKEDTIAIVGGSKTNENVNKKHLYIPYNTRSMKKNNDCNKYFKGANMNQQKIIKTKFIAKKRSNYHSILYSKNKNDSANNSKTITNYEQEKILNKELINKKKHDQSVFNTISDVNDTSKNIKDINAKHKHIVSIKSAEGKLNIINTTFFSDSDESITESKSYNSLKCRNLQESNNQEFQNSLLNYNQTKKNLSKILKRKKLFNGTESYIDLSVTSKENLSIFSPKNFVRYKHPALEISRLTSQQSYIVKALREKSRKKHNRSAAVRSAEKNKLELLNNSFNVQNENIEHNNLNSQTCFQENRKDNNEDSNNSGIVNNKKHNKSTDFTITVQNTSNSELNKQYKLDLLNNSNSSLTRKYKLKDLIISLHRLPYKYKNFNLTNAETHTPNNKNLKEIDKDSEKHIINNIKCVPHIKRNLNDSSINFTDDLNHNFNKHNENCSETFVKKKSIVSDQNENNSNNLKNSIHIPIGKPKYTTPTKKLETMKKVSKKSKIISPLEKSTVKKFKKYKGNTILKESMQDTSALLVNESKINNKRLSFSENDSNYKNTVNVPVKKTKSVISVEKSYLMKEKCKQSENGCEIENLTYRNLIKYKEHSLPHETMKYIPIISSSDDSEPIIKSKNNRSMDKVSNKSTKNNNNYENAESCLVDKSGSVILEATKTLRKKYKKDFLSQAAVVRKFRKHEKRLSEETMKCIPIISSSDESS